MGWLFKAGCSRREMIDERTRNWECTNPDGTVITTTCIAHCYRGGAFFGVLWTVWERSFAKDGMEAQPRQRWICCDLLRYERDYGWGYKDMEESMHPYFYSCPLKYLDLVPADQSGVNEEWRQGVRRYHAAAAGKRRARRTSQPY